MGLKKEAERGWRGEAVEAVWLGWKRGFEGVGGTMVRAGWAFWAISELDALGREAEDRSVYCML